MRTDNTIRAFFALIQGGLWNRDVKLRQFGDIDFADVMRLAEEQSVVGIVTAGIEHVSDVSIPKEITLQFIGQTLQLEQQNTAMNGFIAGLIDDMRKSGIYTLLVKGQGLAQCYEKPLWRACGDVDLLLSDDNYQKAKDFLLPKASFTEAEELFKKHLGLTVNEWLVELHGSLRCGFSKRVDQALDRIYKNTFYGGNVRSWENNNVQIFMLSKENDLIYIFVHFLNHFYKGGVGIRQICDWCRFLWTYRDALVIDKVDSHLRGMGLMSEWKAFGAYAVEYLGMPTEAVPFYSSEEKWERKAIRIQDFIIKTGNMGHNRGAGVVNHSFLQRKVSSLGQRVGDLINHASIFPMDTLRFFPSIMLNGFRQK